MKVIHQVCCLVCDSYFLNPSLRCLFNLEGIAAYNKSVKVHQRVQTEESLAYFKLWNKRYETLTPYPERLIRSLYEDCGTPERFQDINSAAENICQIFNLNLKVLKHAMMQEWLPMIEQYQQEDFYQPYGLESNADAK
jgi:hypothetical protein